MSQMTLRIFLNSLQTLNRENVARFHTETLRHLLHFLLQAAEAVSDVLDEREGL